MLGWFSMLATLGAEIVVWIAWFVKGSITAVGGGFLWFFPQDSAVLTVWMVRVIPVWSSWGFVADEFHIGYSSTVIS